MPLHPNVYKRTLLFLKNIKMENVFKYGKFIKRIFATSSPIIRKKLLTSSNSDIIKAIAEIILNIYHLNFTVSKQGIKQLKKVRPIISKIINKKTSPNTRQQLLIKHSEAFVPIKEVFK